jgi:smad nuclear-interacting protein 1
MQKHGMSKVLPYVIDLGSSNGTYLNNKRIDPQRYYELREKDMLKFGYSSREYVLLHDASQDNRDPPTPTD